MVRWEEERKGRRHGDDTAGGGGGGEPEDGRRRTARLVNAYRARIKRGRVVSVLNARSSVCLACLPREGKGTSDGRWRRPRELAQSGPPSQVRLSRTLLRHC